jgi:shikimate kinase
MPGSGKTTFGKQLAKQLQRQFYDLDQAIVGEMGMTISDIFSMHGESYFRDIESKLLHATQQLKNVVIATGGGCAAYHHNMKWMNEYGLTIYLRANISLLTHRILASKQARPLFEGLNLDGISQKLQAIAGVRLPFYEQAAIVVDVPVKSLETLVKSTDFKGF